MTAASGAARAQVRIFTYYGPWGDSKEETFCKVVVMQSVLDHKAVDRSERKAEPTVECRKLCQSETPQERGEGRFQCIHSLK